MVGTDLTRSPSVTKQPLLMDTSALLFRMGECAYPVLTPATHMPYMEHQSVACLMAKVVPGPIRFMKYKVIVNCTLWQPIIFCDRREPHIAQYGLCMYVCIFIDYGPRHKVIIYNTKLIISTNKDNK